MDIPTQTPYTIDKGQRGLQVYAVQRALNVWALELAEDGIFGTQTEGAVKTFQDAKNLTVDGKFGPASSAKMARTLELIVPTKLPLGLLRGFCAGESGDLIAAVNWSVVGGVDCGYVQRRVYGPPFDDSEAKRAFDSLYQLKLLGTNLAYWFNRYLNPNGSNRELAWRLTALRHNYPYGADRIAAVGVAGLSSYWRTEQDWAVSIGAKFKDGAAVKTPLEWCQRYALGAPEHDDPGLVTQFVKSWI